MQNWKPYYVGFEEQTLIPFLESEQSIVTKLFEIYKSKKEQLRVGAFCFGENEEAKFVINKFENISNMVQKPLHYNKNLETDLQFEVNKLDEGHLFEMYSSIKSKNKYI